MSTNDISNCFLIVIKFDPQAQNPLFCSPLDEQGRPVLTGETGHPFLLVGLVDRQQRKVATPVVQIQLEGVALKTYNGILSRVSELSDMYYLNPNYVANPSKFDEDQKKRVSERIDRVGMEVYALLRTRETTTSETPENRRRNLLQTWLDDIFTPPGGHESAGTRLSQHVTILTNDFSIPWAWAKPSGHKPMLCQVCSVGMLQLATHLSGKTMEEDRVWREKVRQEQLYKALIINGTPELPCAGMELAAVRMALTKPDKWLKKNFEAVDVASHADLVQVGVDYEEDGQRIEQFKVVHFTGHFSPEALVVDGKAIKERRLDGFIDGAVLALDGCSSSSGLKAWADTNTTTAKLISLGASGCIVTQFPLKNDPIVAQVFWGEFYRKIRENASLGLAVGKARAKLKEHFDFLDSHNPAWALYQLIGNPSVQILEAPEDDGEDGR